MNESGIRVFGFRTVTIPRQMKLELDPRAREIRHSLRTRKRFRPLADKFPDLSICPETEFFIKSKTQFDPFSTPRECEECVLILQLKISFALFRK